MDAFHERALGNLNTRHTDRARAEAGRITEYVGYVLRDLEAGRLPNRFARDILASAQEIVSRLDALEAIADTTGILATGESQ